MHVRIVGVGRVGVCIQWSCDSEERENEVGAGVNDAMLSETL